jgi:transposase
VGNRRLKPFFVYNCIKGKSNPLRKREFEKEVFPINPTHEPIEKGSNKFGLIQILLPAIPGLVLFKFYGGPNRLFLSAASIHSKAACPSCLTLSQAVHSYYTRQVSDLPWSERATTLNLQVRRFYCYNPKCPKVTFAERLLPQIKAYARRTLRLDAKLRQLGLTLGGNAGVKLAKKVLGVKLCPATLLNLVRPSAGAELAQSATVIAETEANLKTRPLRRIGVDDFSFRRGGRYGTLIVDLERHQIVDLLPDASSATFEEWLNHHPQIEVISRDRASAYADAARKVAPNAVQVADRFHISKNLHEATERIVKRHYGAISQAFQAQASPAQSQADLADNGGKEGFQASPEIPGAETTASFVPVDPSTLSWRERRRQENVEGKLKQYEQIKELHQRGFSRKEIGQKLNLDAGNVGRHLRGAPIIGARVLRKSKLDPYKPYLMKRYLEEHNDNAKELWREICQQGYQGGYDGVSTFLAQLRFEQDGLELGGNPLTKKLRPLALSVPGRLKAKTGEVIPTVRQLSWYLFLPAVRLKAPALNRLNTVLEAEATVRQAYGLIQSFGKMMQERQAEKLAEWLVAVEESGIAELKSFGAGIKRDEVAVRAGLSEIWSQGVVEGKVNKLKMIKRKLYGRANFALFRIMVLGAETA